MLHDLAVSAGAQIQFDAAVTAVIPDETRPSITLASGETHSADVVIGADGVTSLVRDSIFGEGEEVVGRRQGLTCLGAVIPGEEMEKDPELAAWLKSDEVRSRFCCLLYDL